jgi:hypothetical protein
MAQVVKCLPSKHKGLSLNPDTTKKLSQVPVNHDCNPSYSGGRDQEDLGSKPT